MLPDANDNPNILDENCGSKNINTIVSKNLNLTLGLYFAVMAKIEPFEKPIYITRPPLPDRKAVYRKIDEI